MAASTSPQNNEAAGELLHAPAPVKLTSSGSSSIDSAPIACEDFDDNDIYEDANDDTSTIAQSIDLEQSFIDCEKAIKLFFNNDLKGAMAIMKPWSRISLYHSLGVAIFEFIPAMLTFDAEQIQAAISAIKICITICIKNRRRYTFVESIGSIIKKPNFASYSDLEAHAELCYAEALLLQAALTVIEGEDLTGLIKGTLKVKTCYNTYQACWDIQEVKTWESKDSRVHFKSGVRLGTATFNLMISLLPPKLIAVLEFVGFSGNKYYGLTELDKAANSPGIRAVLCDLTLLAYHLVICQFIGGQGDITYAEQLLEKSLTNFPENVWFLALRARAEFLRGKLDVGIQTYNRAMINQQNFQQFRLLCYWELMWVQGLKLNFQESAYYADLLISQSAWSKTTHSYIKAAMLLQSASSDLTRCDIAVVNDLMRNAPMYKVRIAGKSLPMEKFVIRRCARYHVQQARLLLPGLELMCLWNLFPVLTNNKPQLQQLIRIIEKTRELVEKSACSWMGGYVADNMALLYYVHGCALCAMELPLSAIAELQRVVELKRLIKEDAFLVPYAVCELAMCHYQLGDMETTLNLLNDAKKKFSGYNLESRLHFRVHARVEMVRQRIEGTSYHPATRDVEA